MGIKHADLWHRWRTNHDKAARDELVTEYLWLVRYVAGRLMVGLPPQFEHEDVEGHGCFGLLEAIARYEPERGIRFETFAIPWVRGACLQGVRALQWAPALRKRVRQLERAEAELERLLGRDPTRPELARYLKLSGSQLEQQLAEVGTLSILSLEESFTDADGDATLLQDRLADPNAPDPQERPQESERHERLAEAVDSLPDQERLVVALFYFEELTGREITDLLGVSGARVSQLHSRAILRLRGKLARFKELLVS